MVAERDRADRRARGKGRTLLIAIPALDEESSIESIIERTLAARPVICEKTSVTRVEVVVVSDGSTDGTVERARKYSGDIELIVFPQNRGYGAAIKTAWTRFDADVLGFLDADGTCDPLFFVELCRTLDSADADVVLGSRMGSQSRMPWIRRVGNTLFAVLLRAFSDHPVSDAASGMRVIRRESLHRLAPLPDGLHFTPAMSARAILSPDLRIVEVPMPYSEREGASKLRVWRDGVRFVNVIVESALLHRPSRPLTMAGLAMIAGAAILMAQPVAYYLENGRVAEWMIYRFVVSDLLGTAGALLVGAGYLAGKLARTVLAPRSPSSRWQRWIGGLLSGRGFLAATLLPVGAAGFLVWPSAVELVTTGATYEHWSRFIVASFLALASALVVVLKVLDHVLDLLAERVAYLEGTGPP